MSRETARRLREVRDSYEEAAQAREDAVAAAFEKGGGMREIAEQVGMSHVGVSKMLQRLGLRKPWRTLAEANAELDRRDALAREQNKNKP